MKYSWLNKFCSELIAENILKQGASEDAPLPLLHVDSSQWKAALHQAAQQQLRFVAIWAEDVGECFRINCCFEFSGTYILLRSAIAYDVPYIAAATVYFPAANRLERHAHDMFGIVFIDHPDQRRWTCHQAWSEKEFPLRKDFVATTRQQAITPSDMNYPFTVTHGAGICEIPVGPVHAGIIEPGHFRFQVAGEDILNLEEHLGYTHKGVEKAAQKRDIAGLIKLAGRVSGDSTVAYAWATCQACEHAYAIEIPARAMFLRAIMCERERIANHLGDFAAICNDVGFAFAYYQFMRLKELWLRLNAEVFGHRLMMDCVKVGGVKSDLTSTHKTALHQQLVVLKKELDELYSLIEDNSSLHDRLKNTGILHPHMAQQLGALGFVGRASGSTFDLRCVAPYAPYNQLTTLRVPTYKTGDALARTRIRAQEILVTLEVLRELLEKIPAGEISVDIENILNANRFSGLQANRLESVGFCASRPPSSDTKLPGAILPALQARPEEREAGLRSAIPKCDGYIPKIKTAGIGLIEGWRGEILVYVSFDDSGLVERFFPRDPSWFSWPALEQLIHGNIVPDFPVCNKSINGSYSGVDL